MKIDRMMFNRFADSIRDDQAVIVAVEAGNWELARGSALGANTWANPKSITR